MAEMCRICRDTEQMDLVSLYQNGILTEVGTSFEECFGLVVAGALKYTKICIFCHIQLCNFHEMKMIALRNDVITQIQLALDTPRQIAEAKRINLTSLTSAYAQALLNGVDTSSDTDENLAAFHFNANRIRRRSAAKRPMRPRPTILRAAKEPVVVRSHKCNFCKRKFLTSMEWQHHVSIHNEANTYECDICHQRYKTSRTLKVHKASIHDGIRFACALCNRDFSRKDYLTSHIRKHV